MIRFFTFVSVIWFFGITENAGAQQPAGALTGLKFIENKGQWDSTVKFAADVPGGKLSIKKNQLHYTFYDTESLAKQHHPHLEVAAGNARSVEDIGFEDIPLEHIMVEFKGANSDTDFKVKKREKTIYNYYLTDDPAGWATDCRAYEEVMYSGLYPGIDLRLYSQHDHLKYDLVLKKGADPNQIKFSYLGVEKMAVKNRQLYCETKINTIIENIPYAYQVDSKGRKKEVPCDFRLQGNEVSFHFPEGYDPKKALVIDPQLIFSTFSGSVADNFGYTACFDDDGNLYSGGIVFGSGFPGTGNTFQGGSYDIGILKFDSSGRQLLYATYIGGASQDTPHSLIVNNQNELLVLGTTGSSDYPTSFNAYDNTFNGGTPFVIFDSLRSGSDIVLTKLNASGGVIASTFVGSNGNDGILKMNTIGSYNNALIRNYGDYIRGDIIVDRDDNIYVASSTDVDGFPVTSAIQPSFAGGNSDAVVFKMSNDLSNLMWSTYLGGSSDDATYSIKIDSSGFVYVGGGTNSSDFMSTAGVINETLQGNIDGFVTKIDLDNDMIVSSTFLGTDAYDQVYFIDLDESENIYALGQTKGGYPITTGVYHNPNSGQFIHKLTNEMDSTMFSLVFGSGTLEPNISPTAFLVNECENIFLSGWGGNTNFLHSPNRGTTNGLPVTDDAIFRTTDGSDFYLMALAADGSDLLYGTFFGSTNSSGDHVDGGTSRFDKRGIIYQSVCTCGGSADNFPTTPGAWSNINRGISRTGQERCNNAAFKFDLASLEANLETNNLIGNDLGINDGCAPLEIMFLNQSIGGVEFFWNFGDGNTSTQRDSVVNVFQNPGAYLVTLTARDINTCTVEDIASTIITVHDESFTISEDVEICGGETTRLSASGGVGYIWTDEQDAFVSDIANPVVRPDTTSTYKVNVIDSNGCTFEDSLTITVIPEVTASFNVNKLFNCESIPIVGFENTSVNAETFRWDFGDGNTSEDESPVYQFQEPGDYEATLTAFSQGCTSIESTSISLSDLFIPNIVTMNNDGKNEKFELSFGDSMAVTIFNRWGRKLFESANYQNDWPPKDISPGVYYYEALFPNGTPCNGWVHVMKR